MKILTDKSVKLCCGNKKTNCPVITKIDEETFEVTDDFGGKVILKKHELDMMNSASTFFNTSKKQPIAENLRDDRVLING